MRSLSWDEVVRRRVARSSLRERQLAHRLGEVVAEVCGLQAQLLPAAELGIAARVADVTRADVHAALWERREIVKAHTLRGTIHLHPAADLPLYFAACRAVAPWRETRYLRPRRVTEEQTDQVTGAARDALDGRALTYRELETEIVSRVGRWAAAGVPERVFGQDNWPVWRQLLVPAEGPFCFGPKRGNAVTLVRADQWIPGWRDVDAAGALREVLRRYLRAYGPATPRDFGHWFNTSPQRASDLFATMSHEIVEVDVDGFRAWTLTERDADPPTARQSVRLLPDYDCYTIGSHPPGEQRTHLIPTESGNRVFGGGAGPFAAVVVDGRVVGVWKRKSVGKRVEISVWAFRPLTARVRRGIEAEAERVGEYLGSNVETSFLT